MNECKSIPRRGGTPLRAEYHIVFTTKEYAELIPFEQEKKELDPEEVAGKTIMSLISPGTEIAIYKGNGNFSFPINPGYAAIFQVEAIGENVKDIKAGDYVFCMDNHKSYIKLPRKDVLPLPKGLKPEIALFARLAAVSMTTLVTTRSRPPQKVLINGLGIIGHLAAQIFQSCGYDVIGCDSGANRRELALRKGIKKVIQSLNDPELVGKIALVLECRGNEQDVLTECKMVCQGGEIVLVGVPWEQRANLSAHELLNAVFYNYAIIRSGWEWELPTYSQKSEQLSVYDNIKRAMRWLAEGRINIDGLYNKVSPIDAQTIYQNILNRKSNYLTSIFDWTLI